MKFEDGLTGFLEGEVVCEMLELSSCGLRILQPGISKPRLVFTHTNTHTRYAVALYMYNIYNKKCKT